MVDGFYIGYTHRKESVHSLFGLETRIAPELIFLLYPREQNLYSGCDFYRFFMSNAFSDATGEKT